MSLDDLPDRLAPWCLTRLGGEPVEVLFQRQQTSMVFGVRLAGGTEVVVKARADDGRPESCVAAQAEPAKAGPAGPTTGKPHSTPSTSPSTAASPPAAANVWRRTSAEIGT
jgi:hypothetical protein